MAYIIMVNPQILAHAGVRPEGVVFATWLSSSRETEVARRRGRRAASAQHKPTIVVDFHLCLQPLREEERDGNPASA